MMYEKKNNENKTDIINKIRQYAKHTPLGKLYRHKIKQLNRYLERLIDRDNKRQNNTKATS